MSAAEALADMGMEVLLVEKEPQPGGLLNRIHRLAPTGDKAEELVKELVDRVKGKKKIKLCLSSEVAEVGGFIGNFEVTINKAKGKPIKDIVGVIVVATGAEPFKPAGLFGYNGRNVITQIELEEKLKKGPIDAKNVVILQCVGARSEERSYCSRICCLTAVKNALYIKGQNPDAQVTILYRDIQMYGAENERLLWESRGKGVRFDVYDVERPPVVGESKVEFYQPLMGEMRDLPFDLVVLSTPLVARADAPGLSQLMRLPIDQNKFFLEAHAKLRPLDFATDGIFVCGSARYPATYWEARAQGLGSASRAGTVLFKDKLVTSPLVAEINENTCVGCQGCLGMCPYGAINYLEEKRICKVNTVLCKGCGNCASTCPSQSVQLKGFTSRQLLSQIRRMVC
jgi:heterodisulfide reductase subunit A